ncbi:MAG: hypothetical protein ACTH4J_18855 [Vibrio toranzoniae]|uniref:hypothetical protein n=1 Tax=Vibrio toranzoniae TaxID=1194427 RepID=UPI003F9C5DE0
MDLANLTSPNYFLKRIDDSCKWPGNRSNNSDYLLNYNIWLDKDEVINLEPILYYTKSSKVAWRGLYTSKASDLNYTVYTITRDISAYLSIPFTGTSANELEFSHIKFDSASLDDYEVLIDAPLSLSEVYFLSREFLLSDTDDELVARWLSVVKKRFPTPEPELHIWLSLLTHKIGQTDLSLEMLNREYVADYPENGLISMLKANISLANGNRERYFSYYLHAMSALATVYPPSKIIKHFSAKSPAESCQNIWKSVLSERGMVDNDVVLQHVDSFCTNASLETSSRD